MDLGVEGELFATAIAGTDDLDGEVRSAAPVGAAVLCCRAGTKDGDVGAAVIEPPAFLPITDVYSNQDRILARKAESDLNDGPQTRGNGLMFIIWQGGHDVDSIPHLVIPVAARAFSLGFQLANQDRVTDV